MLLYESTLFLITRLTCFCRVLKKKKNAHHFVTNSSLTNWLVQRNNKNRKHKSVHNKSKNFITAGMEGFFLKYSENEFITFIKETNERSKLN